MNPLITIQEFHYQPADNFYLVYCAPATSQSTEYLPNSYVYYIQENTEAFILKARSIEFDDEKTIICYDNGDFTHACQAYWGFRATGFDEVRVLVGGLKACEEFGLDLTEDEMPEITSSNHPYLPFNNSVVLTKDDFVKKQTCYQQTLRASSLPFDLLDTKGNLILQTQLTKNLETNGIVFNTGKSTVVHGNASCLVGILLTYLGEKSVSVVIESTEGLGPSKDKRRKTRELSFHAMADGGETTYTTPSPDLPKQAETKHYKLPTTDDLMNERRTETGRASNNCCTNCNVF